MNSAATPRLPNVHIQRSKHLHKKTELTAESLVGKNYFISCTEQNHGINNKDRKLKPVQNVKGGKMAIFMPETVKSSTCRRI